MWLIDTATLKLKEFSGQITVDYAILSHRWEEDEVLFRDLGGTFDLNLCQAIHGFRKIEQFCQQARRDELQWAWIDTCCIDKSSSAALSESINSMFRWYRQATVCYVYLYDVNTLEDLDGSEWFKRGWTLQELLAPTSVRFFSRDWTFLSDKESLFAELADITRISPDALLDFNVDGFCVAEKMSWAAGRLTTREEDRAYCLMGLFDVNMPLLYGEGEKAFGRLQEVIMESSTDLSIFLWNGRPYAKFSLLAASPSCFSVKLTSSMYSVTYSGTHPLLFGLTKGWTRNNAGVWIQLSLYPFFIGEDQEAVFIALIHEPGDGSLAISGMYLQRVQPSCKDHRYKRISVDGQTACDVVSMFGSAPFPYHRTFTTDLQIVKEPMVDLGSSGSRHMIIKWEGPKHLRARVCQKPLQWVDGPLEQWQITTALELQQTSRVSFERQLIEAQGILGYLLVHLPSSKCLLVCLGYGTRFEPLCVVVICGYPFYANELKASHILHAYNRLLDGTDRDEAIDKAAATHVVRAPAGWTSFMLFDGSLSLSLQVDRVDLRLSSDFFRTMIGDVSSTTASSDDSAIEDRQFDLFGLSRKRTPHP